MGIQGQRWRLQRRDGGPEELATMTKLLAEEYEPGDLTTTTDVLAEEAEETMCLSERLRLQMRRCVYGPR